MEYSGAGGKLIHEKNQKQKISWHCPFKHNFAPRWSQRIDRIKYAISDIFVEKVFLNKFLNLQKLDGLCPGRFVIWTFCKMDVL